jgi:hypothetical protein
MDILIDIIYIYMCVCVCVCVCVCARAPRSPQSHNTKNNNHINIPTQFPPDMVARAKAYLAAQPMGAYSNSQVYII